MEISGWYSAGHLKQRYGVGMGWKFPDVWIRGHGGLRQSLPDLHTQIPYNPNNISHVIIPLYNGNKMEIRIQDKGRITLPIQIRKVLGVRDNDTLLLEIEGGRVVLRPKNIVSVREAKGIAKHEVKLEEVEEALGRDEIR